MEIICFCIFFSERMVTIKGIWRRNQKSHYFSERLLFLRASFFIKNKKHCNAISLLKIIVFFDKDKNLPMQNRFENKFRRPVQKYKIALHATTKNTTFYHKNGTIMQQNIIF